MDNDELLRSSEWQCNFFKIRANLSEFLIVFLRFGFLYLLTSVSQLIFLLISLLILYECPLVFFLSLLYQKTLAHKTNLIALFVTIISC